MKVLQLLCQNQTVTRSRQRLTQTTYTVTDHTRTMTLTVWGDSSVLIGNCYETTNVFVRLFKQTPCLNTTVQTTCSLIDDCGSSAEVEQGERENVGEIVDTDVRVEYL